MIPNIGRVLFMAIFASIFGSAAELVAMIECDVYGCDPTMLSSQETIRAFASFSRSDDFESFDHEGRAYRDLSPESRNTTHIYLSRKVSGNSHVVMAAPYIVNKREARQRSGWGDPQIYGMRVWHRCNESVSISCQARAVFGYQAGNATSDYTYQDPSKLDVVGTGFSLLQLGADAVMSAGPWQFAGMNLIYAPLNQQRTEFGKVERGLEYHASLAAGFHVESIGTLQLGWLRRQSLRKRLNGEAIDHSDDLSHDLFAGMQGQLGHDSWFKLGYARSAALRERKNTARVNTIRFGLIKAM